MWFHFYLNVLRSWQWTVQVRNILQCIITIQTEQTKVKRCVYLQSTARGINIKQKMIAYNTLNVCFDDVNKVLYTIPLKFSIVCAVVQ